VEPAAQIRTSTSFLLTLFSTPKAFIGPVARLQRNALANWKALGPEVEILLMGDDLGVAEAAEEFGCRHVSGIARNARGTPLVDDIFRKGRKIASAPLLCYINADILVPPSITDIACSVSKRLPEFLLAGRRWNTDVYEDLSFEGDWPARLERLRRERGVLFSPDAVDYFIFPKALFADMPPFAIGRFAWDSWILRKAKAGRIPIVDATESLAALHQNHDYAHLTRSGEAPSRDVNSECRENIRLLHEEFPDSDECNSSLAAAGRRYVPERGLVRNWTLDRLRWLAYYSVNNLRGPLKNGIRRTAGEKTLQKLVVIKRRCFGRPPAALTVSPASVPIFIISYNRLSYLRQLVAWLEAAGHNNIIIVDNASDWPPLPEYLEQSPHRVERLSENMGRFAVWQCGRFGDILKTQLYVVTDCDILPDPQCPPDAVKHFAAMLARHPKLTKIGFSLRIDDLPDHFAEKADVIAWESAFRKRSVPGEPLFDAVIDTTFALYRPGIFPDSPDWWLSARTSSPYVARHLPWYENSAAPDAEALHYSRSVSEENTHWSAVDAILRKECQRLRERVLALEEDVRLLSRNPHAMLYIMCRKMYRALCKVF
jgi:hypothetical protein